MNHTPKKFLIATFYQFTRLPDYRSLREILEDVCSVNAVVGTILLAEEGINGTISGPQQGVDTVLEFLHDKAGLKDLSPKLSYATWLPFQHLRIKIRREIVTMGLAEIDPPSQSGTYVSPAEWQVLLEDPEVLLVDTRNEYEVAIGTFKGALNPHIGHFRDFPTYVRKQLDPAKHRKVAMFCTGGIRCEKASSFMRRAGFENVYHLKGGILKYLEEIPPTESGWEGECFVFDERVSVDHRLKPGHFALCKGCGNPVRKPTKASSSIAPFCGSCKELDK